MKPIVDHHHYKADRIDPTDRVAVYERYVIDLLLQSSLGDDNRDSSIAFELKHHHSTAQFARVLARQRKLPIDICTVGALLHDVYVAKYGSYKDHAHKSADLASTIIDELGKFTEEEKEQILSIVFNHSDKEVWSDNPFEEFGKDVDTLDSFLYPNAFGYYLKHKKLAVFYNYVLRAKKVWDELNIPQPSDFTIFDNFKEPWLDSKIELSEQEAETFLGIVIQLSASVGNEGIVPPTMLFKANGSFISFYVNSGSYKVFNKAVSSRQEEIRYSDLADAKKLVDLCQQSYILVWSGIDAYEILTENANATRLSELGLNIPNHQKYKGD